MKYLTIIRHAKSSWESETGPDIERPLNERGKKAIPLVGKYLKKNKMHPGLVLSSPAKRALKTAKEICGYIGYDKDEIEIHDEIYYGDSNGIFQLIRKLDDKPDDVFLFGHEPKLSSLIQMLTGKTIDKFSTCSVYRMKFETDNWKEIQPGTGKCEFYVNPKLLGEK
jgi:phosphohistidine phosphatase